jgi:multidrug resistance efflux pump
MLSARDQQSPLTANAALTERTRRDSEPTLVVGRTEVHSPLARLGQEGTSGAIGVARPAEVGIVRERTLFREQAVRSYLATMREGEVLRVSPPWARRFLVVASVTLLGLLTTSFFAMVDQTARARGTLRVAGGVQAVACQSTGVVQELTARSGDTVAAGAVLARIDSTVTKMALLDAEREIERAVESLASFTAQRDKEQAQRIKLLQQRAGLLARRTQNQRASVGRLRQRAATFTRLADEGLASSLDKGEAENDLAAAERAALELDGEISATQLQISTIAADIAAELDRRKADVRKAIDRREALSFQLQQTEVTAPRAGRLDALVAKVGDPVSVGMTIARIIPESAPREIVVFLPEADRAFLRERADVRVELDQLPAGEFGGLRGKVVRIGADLATPAEVHEALAEAKVDGPTYRLEISLEDGESVRRLDTLLRPGSLVNARFVLRRRRLATVVFAPLRRFVDE